jgi:hypothetical protein
LLRQMLTSSCQRPGLHHGHLECAG